jgi:POT family proton-dependent oligopeptide transporter
VADDGRVFGHPRGLTVLAATELWDRISFHGMQALLVLYMVEELLRPGHVENIRGFIPLRHVIEAVTGHLSSQALASQIFGLYMGLIYFTPVFGGMLGDRVLGRQRAVIVGALLMTAGHFCMAFDRSFLLALILLIIGAGCLRGNLISQVGNLYSETDRRRDDAFQIYYVLLNSGAFVAPLITGTLAQAYGWHYGFVFAGFGMLVGLVIYVNGKRHLPIDTRADAGRRVPLNAVERRVILFQVLMLPMLTLFWVAQSQIWNTYNLWARDHVDLMVGGWRMPVPWLQAVDALGAIVMVPPILLFWKWQARRSREPDDFAKLAIGCLIFAVSMAWLAAAGLIADAGGKTPLAWVLAFHVLACIGYIYFAPIAVALFSRTAPAVTNAMMLGVCYLSVFAGSTISGRLGGLYEILSSAEFWLLHAAIVAGAGLLILLFAGSLRREIKASASVVVPERPAVPLSCG